MICFQAYINPKVVAFLKQKLETIIRFEKANSLLRKRSGVINFFNNQDEFEVLKKRITDDVSLVEDLNRREYGDFQTNKDLAIAVAQYIQKEGVSPEFVIEPTCGKGNFIIAALKRFDTIKRLVGIEIYQPYVWETKFNILHLYLENETKAKPSIEIIHANIFEFPLGELSESTKDLETVVIGNPPWVTNSELGSINSKNLPPKSNFKNYSGLDAITGKGNFDIGEYISILMLKAFGRHHGVFAFLIKTSVVKNLVFEQRNVNYKIGRIKRLNIDAKMEFNVSVNACLFYSKLNQPSEYTCKELDFYSQESKTEFGWYNDKFVYSISDYKKVENIDGVCQFVWRQGLKHDCSKVMELEKSNSHYTNALKQEIILENDLLYGLLKSSDLKEEEVSKYRKTTIVTQKKVGQDTNYIKKDYPKTFQYLHSNRSFFEKRKSSIYRGKPPFSIFGIGDYSFAPYKVAISGMYKRTLFTLVYPDRGKPIMLDDTCYFIGFDDLTSAKVAQYLLNSESVQNFLKSIIFPDSKRSITKDVLMRVDFRKIIDLVAKPTEIERIKIDDWKSFEGLLKKDETISNQITLF